MANIDHVLLCPVGRLEPSLWQIDELLYSCESPGIYVMQENNGYRTVNQPNINVPRPYNQSGSTVHIHTLPVPTPILIVFPDTAEHDGRYSERILTRFSESYIIHKLTSQPLDTAIVQLRDAVQCTATRTFTTQRHATYVALKLRNPPLSLPPTERMTCSSHQVPMLLEPIGADS